MSHRILLLLALALFAGACSAGAAPEPLTTLAVMTTSVPTTVTTLAELAGTTSTAASSTSSSLAPTTTVDTRIAIRAAFIAMESEWEASSTAVLDAHGDGGMVPWEHQPAWCSDQSAVDDTWAEAVAEYSWPNELQGTADDLVMALIARSDVFGECALLPGSYMGQSPIFNSTDAAYLALNAARDDLRLALGLPAIEYG